MADTLDIVVPDSFVDRTPTFWLITQALEALNTGGKAADLAYSHLVELLRERRDAVPALFELLRSTPAEDIGLRWCALHVVGDIGDLSAAKLLFRASLQPLPRPCREEEGCEGPRDGELLIRTMAVEALHRVAARHEEAGELVLRLIAERPVQPVLVEAVKIARALNLTDKAREVLRKKDAWILDIRIHPVDDVIAEPERGDDTAFGRTPPSMRTLLSSPTASCCSLRKEG